MTDSGHDGIQGMTRFSYEVDGFRHGSIPAVTKIGPLYTSSPIPPLLPGADGPAADVDTQVDDLFAMIGLHLSAAGIDWDDLAKVEFFIDEPSSRAAINKAWLKRFPHPTMRPARHTHHEPSLLPGAHVVASFIAYRDDL